MSATIVTMKPAWIHPKYGRFITKDLKVPQDERNKMEEICQVQKYQGCDTQWSPQSQEGNTSKSCIWFPSTKACQPIWCSTHPKTTRAWNTKPYVPCLSLGMGSIQHYMIFDMNLHASNLALDMLMIIRRDWNQAWSKYHRRQWTASVLPLLNMLKYR